MLLVRRNVDEIVPLLLHPSPLHSIMGERGNVSNGAIHMLAADSNGKIILKSAKLKPS